MLHVQPPPAAAVVPPIFDPMAFIAYMERRGMPVEAREIDGVRSVAWDLTGGAVDEAREPQCNFAAASDDDRQKLWEVLRAREWIAGARECGLVVAPWRENGSKIPELDRGGVMISGREPEGENDYSAASHRFLTHPAVNAADDCRKGVVFEVLCAELGLDPDDPDLIAKVNDHCRKAYSEAAVQ